jgi:hypothetical protein
MASAVCVSAVCISTDCPFSFGEKFLNSVERRCAPSGLCKEDKKLYSNPLLSVSSSPPSDGMIFGVFNDF